MSALFKTTADAEKWLTCTLQSRAAVGVPITTLNTITAEARRVLASEGSRHLRNVGWQRQRRVELPTVRANSRRPIGIFVPDGRGGHSELMR